ncbi:MAG: ATP-binding domain-containing protein [Ignavibacteriaceae bacterium]|nr:ATP-binding domain-containing protein [Ignavibacteriaceae bacterium]
MIDESSLISNTFSQSEHLRFGSGHLLKDLFTFIYDGALAKRKIIFFGDKNQLPPVNSAVSVALYKKELLKINSNFKIEEYELTEILRQAAESTIIKNATKIKESIERKYFGSLNLEFNETDFQKLGSSEFLDHFCKDYQHLNLNSKVIIAYTNESVFNYNMSVKKRLQSGNTGLCKNDVMLVYQNNIKYGVFNGQSGVLESFSDIVEEYNFTLPLKDGEKETVKLCYRDVHLKFISPEGTSNIIEAKIFVNFLESDSPSITKSERGAILVHFKIRNEKNLKQLKEREKELLNELKKIKKEEANKPGVSEKFYKIKSELLMIKSDYNQMIKNDPYMNALFVKYGYALTCHKAQGGEWRDVYFDFSAFDRFSEFYFRFCYTGITRASEKVYSINYQAGRSIRFIENNSTATNQIIPVETSGVELSLPGQIQHKIEELLHSNGIPHTVQLLNYRIRANSEVDGSYADVIYNSKGLISRIQSSEPNETNHVYTILKQLEGKHLVEKTGINFENPIQQGIYENIEFRLKVLNVSITAIHHYQYLERYTIEANSENCVLNIYYKKNGKITSVNLQSGSKELFEKIRVTLDE